MHPKSMSTAMWIQLNITPSVCLYYTWCSCSVWRCWQPFDIPDRAGSHLDSLPPKGTEQWWHVRKYNILTVVTCTVQSGKCLKKKNHIQRQQRLIILNGFFCLIQFDLKKGCYSRYSVNNQELHEVTVKSIPCAIADLHICRICQSV